MQTTLQTIIASTYKQYMITEKRAMDHIMIYFKKN